MSARLNQWIALLRILSMYGPVRARDLHEFYASLGYKKYQAHLNDLRFLQLVARTELKLPRAYGYAVRSIYQITPNGVRWLEANAAT